MVDVPREFRSSKREVVLGLGIGLGLSMLLAAIGQAYFREDVIADRQASPGVREPASIESVTLSSRPDSPGGATNANRSVAPLSPEPAHDKGGAARSARSERVDVVARDGASAPRTVSGGRASSRPPAISKREASSPSHPASGVAVSIDARPESTRGKRAARVPERSPERERRLPPLATQPPAFDVDKPLSDAPPERAPLSPAQSAGLGLDLPL
jgi:hypothetical protein